MQLAAGSSALVENSEEEAFVSPRSKSIYLWEVQTEWQVQSCRVDIAGWVLLSGLYQYWGFILLKNLGKLLHLCELERTLIVKHPLHSQLAQLNLVS